MSDRFSSPAGGLSRNGAIVGSVVLLHIAALWALQSGLLQRVATVVIPVTILSPFIEPPKPKEIPPPPAPPPPAKAAIHPKVTKAPPPPRPVAIRRPAPAPAPDAPTGVIEPQPPAPLLMTAPTPPEPAPAPAPAAPPAVQLPATDAAYAQSCSPVYPSMSKRFGEQGKVVIKVVVGADGRPKQAAIRKSSGFERLDQAALEALMRCRFSPGKVNGVAQTMAYDAPVNFVLN